MEEDYDFEESKEFEDGIDNEKHWKSLGIASAVISFICIMILIMIVIMTPAKDDSSNIEPYSLEEVFSKQILKGHHFNGTFISEHEFIYQSADKNIIHYDCKTGLQKAITNKLNTTSQQIVDFQMSPLSRTFLLVTTSKPASKQSTWSTFDCGTPLEYFLYDLRNGNVLNLAEEMHSRMEKSRKTDKKDGARGNANIGSKSIESTSPCATIQSAQWAPRGELFLTVANDIYRLQPDNSEANIDRLTYDGSLGDTLLNGFNDFMYRDFIFGKWNSLWWSRNVSRQYLCFLKVNNSAVPVSTVAIYSDGSASSRGESQRNYRYPVIDSPIGEATLWIIDLDENRTQRKPRPIMPPSKVVSNEHFVTFVDWTASDQLLVVWTLRNQRRSIVGICEATNNWRCQEVMTLKNWFPLKHLPGSILPATQGRRQLNGAVSNAEYFLCCQIPEHGEKAFHQLYSLNTQTRTITPYLNMANSGNDLQVSQLLAYNADSQLIFFVGQSLSRVDGETVTEQDMRSNIFIFSVHHGTTQCLTCRLVGCHRKRSSPLSSKQKGLSCLDASDRSGSIENDSDEESCLFESAHFGPEARIAAITCLSGIIPRVYLVRFSNLSHPHDGAVHAEIVQSVTLLEDNASLEQRIASKIIPNVESFVISRQQGNTLKYLRLKILTPRDFNSGHVSKYPLIFKFGPAAIAKGGNEKHREYRREQPANPDTEWAMHLVTQHQLIFAWLDGHLSEDYSQPGNDDSLEQLVDDHRAALEFLQDNLTFVNLKQSCLLGSNVGGSLVLLALSSWSPFPCGLAISPIIDWHSIHTLLAEQYLDWARFQSSDLSYLLKINLNHSRLHSKRIFLLSGTANALVPLSQSMQLTRDLTLEQLKPHSPQVDCGSNSSASDDASFGLHLFEPLVNQDNTADTLLEYLYRKMEFFLFKFVIVSA